MRPATVRLVLGRGLNQTAVAAIRKAYDKLQDPQCQLVFSDFTDASGTMLQQRLTESHQTSASYLASIGFDNGEGDRPCQNPATLAFTSPQSQLVHLCGWRFTRLALHEPHLAAGIVIHEELHSLGLGENPPASSAVTARVISRCGK